MKALNTGRLVDQLLHFGAETPIGMEITTQQGETVIVPIFAVELDTTTPGVPRIKLVYDPEYETIPDED